MKIVLARLQICTLKVCITVFVMIMLMQMKNEWGLVVCTEYADFNAGKKP